MLRAVTCCVVLSLFSLPSWAEAVANSQSATAAILGGNSFIERPSWATPDRFRGRLDGKTSITIQVHLPLQNLEAAKAELEAVSDPDSPRYGQYLTSEEFEAKYSPTAVELSAVRGYLESAGFQVIYVPRNRLFLSASAPAATVERVFATHLGQYEVESGQLRRAPIEPATMPATLASHVSGVLGLHTSTVKSAAIVGGTQASQGPVVPTCSDYLGQHFDLIDPPYGGGYPSPTPLYPCGLTPPRVRRAYGLDEAVAAGNDGRGVRIAVLDAFRSPTLVSDAQEYAAQFDPAHPLRASQISLVDAPSGGDPAVPVDYNWYYEQLLDVESVHAIAPGAHIVYVSSPTNGNEDAVAQVNFVVQEQLASIVTNSWYLDVETAPDSYAAVLDPIFIQAGLKGIGMYFVTGDWGDYQTGFDITGQGAGGSPEPVTLYPGSSPYVTAVGGTSLFLNRDGSPAYETGWESGDSLPIADANGVIQWVPAAPGIFIFGAGGGPSHIYAQPTYQRRIVPAALAGSPAARVIPDVAMLADFDSGVMEGLTDPYSLTYTVYQNSGGTSLATPLIAATVALAEQRAGHHIGFANPKFYKVASSAFRDIAPTKVPRSIAHAGVWQDTEDPAGLLVQRADGTIVPHTLHSAVGFDNVTGLGVPKGEAFLEAVSGR
jgi:subtilase family serine protease